MVCGLLCGSRCISTKCRENTFSRRFTPNIMRFTPNIMLNEAVLYHTREKELVYSGHFSEYGSSAVCLFEQLQLIFLGKLLAKKRLCVL